MPRSRACLNLVESVCAGEVDDVNGRFRHLCDRDRAMNAFGFGDGGSRQRVILRRRVSFLQSAFDDLVDHDSVFGVHANQSAALACGGHGAEDCCVVDEEDARIGHEHLEARHAFVHGCVEFFDLLVFEFGCDQVKAVIDCGLSFGFLVPVVDAFDQRLTFVLDGEVDDARCATVRGSDRSGAKVV